VDTDLPFREWRDNWWSGFRSERSAGLLLFPDMVAIMSKPRHRERLNGDYVSSVSSYAQQFFDTLREVTHAGPFWDPAPQ
jgi:hypothetical protein